MVFWLVWLYFHVWLHQIFCIIYLIVHLISISMLYCCSDSNSLVPTILLLTFCWTSTYIPTLLTDGLGILRWYCFDDWIFIQYFLRISSQRLLDSKSILLFLHYFKNTIRIRPHQITHSSIMWNLLLSINRSDLINGIINCWAQASMYAENSIIDYCS